MFNQAYVVLLIIIVSVFISWFAFSPVSKDFVPTSHPPPLADGTLKAHVKIAIIGSGIGGSSTAYFIRKHVGPRADIHVYEKSTKVGGRLAVEEFHGDWYEAGGSIIHSSNEYMVNFIKELGLEERPVNMGDGSTFGIWNGKEFVFLESEKSFMTKLKLVWRYGVFSLWHLHQSLSNILLAFQNVYKLQDQGMAFRSVADLLKSIGGERLFNYTQKTAEEVMLGNGIGELLIQELVTAVTRNNYGQDSNVNAFTGYVSMAGAQGGSLFAVKRGNYLVPKQLLQTANATTFTNRHVNSIRKEVLGGKLVYFLDDERGDSIRKEVHDGQVVYTLGDNDHAYDAVIVAAPLEVPECYIKCVKCSNWPEEGAGGRYQQTIATFVQADINYTYFGIDENESAPSDIFTTEDVSIPFSSIGKQTDITGAHVVTPRVYKVFSRKVLKNETLKRMFKMKSSAGEWYRKSVHWSAYPHYTPPESFSPFVLDDAVFYVNAIERAASAMEMSAIGGRNAALLTKQYLLDREKRDR